MMGNAECLSDSLAQDSAIAGCDYKQKAVQKSHKRVLHVGFLNTIRVFLSISLWSLTLQMYIKLTQPKHSVLFTGMDEKLV